MVFPATSTPKFAEAPQNTTLAYTLDCYGYINCFAEVTILIVLTYNLML